MFYKFATMLSFWEWITIALLAVSEQYYMGKVELELFFSFYFDFMGLLAIDY